MRGIAKNYFRCDRCNKEIEYGDVKDPNEMTIANRCWSLRTNHGQAGYGSQFDGSYIEFDVCDHCLGEILKEFKNKEDILNSGSNYHN